ncbi:hypothetical protein [Luteolibacter sp. LG18]|uniref:hypothetical protein n=1 Tax=Luteolibacter sp. LG18 TaxID=2819286 RepID=UPI0030C6675D
MKPSITGLALAGVLACVSAQAEEAPPQRLKNLKIEDAKPQEGVFLTYTGYETTVLELKGGKFRYWFESDMKGQDDPAYPLTGTYTVQGNVVTLANDKIYQPARTWTVLTVNGTPSLWRSDAAKLKDTFVISDLAYFRRYGQGSILVPAKQGAEDTWKHRGAPTIPVPKEE